MITILLGIILLCLLVVLADVIAVFFRLKSLLEQTKPQTPFKKAGGYTFLGKYCSDLIEGLYFKISSLNLQIEERRNENRLLELQDGKASSADLFKKILLSAFVKTRADTIAVVSYTSDENSKPQIKYLRSKSRQEIQGKLLKYLPNYYKSFFYDCDESLLGKRDGYQSDSLTGDFCLFGYRFVYAQPFSYLNNDGKAVRGLLWFAYANNLQPLPEEIDIYKDFALKIEKELLNERLIEELAGKVNEEKVLNKKRNEFIAHASHDIRAPLNNIRSILNLINLDSSNQEHREFLDVALGNCADMEEIINAIMDFSRYQAGQLVAKKEKFDLNMLAREAVNNQRFAARLKNLSLDIKYDKNYEAVVEADKRHLRRVVNNLLSNAIKYTKQGSVELEVLQDHNGFSRLIVRDTGVGMNEEQLELLFTPFCRFHQAEAEGIGLGLTLTKILLELNAGKIRVESKVNGGSVFEIKLPCQSVRSVSLDNYQANLNSAAAALEVLVLDDDALAVESLAERLSRQGYSVTKCYNVSDAISFINFSKPDILLTDYNMPEGGARRLLGYIKNKGIKISTCVLSGSDDSNLHAELKNLGVDLIQQKGCDLYEIETWMKQVLEERIKIKPEKAQSIMVA